MSWWMAYPKLFYLLIVSIVFGSYFLRKYRLENKNHAFLQKEIGAGLTEPASLHPVIDPSRCLGCASCIVACPEQTVLGIINGKAALIGPTHCIGHGACKDECPTGAISLVFGTETRGVDIPHVNPDFESNVPGVYIAGELGGMGLIRNAIEQGRQAMDSIKASIAANTNDCLDVLIVGAGPAGISATLAAQQHGLNYRTVEQEALGGTVSHYPRGKIVMTASAELPIVGKTKFSETTKESLLEYWRDIEQKTGIEIHYSERVEHVEAREQKFMIKTSVGEYAAKSVLLAIGRRGSPRKLGVPGENSTKVVYSLVDAGQYRNQRVLVCGGGDSALEAAIALAGARDTEVTISYRKNAFSRAKKKNLEAIEGLIAGGRVYPLLGTTITEITRDSVLLQQEGQSIRIDNDVVIVCAGGVLPTAFLESIGIAVETHYGAASA